MSVAFGLCVNGKQKGYGKDKNDVWEKFSYDTGYIWHLNGVTILGEGLGEILRELPWSELQNYHTNEIRPFKIDHT